MLDAVNMRTNSVSIYIPVVEADKINRSKIITNCDKFHEGNSQAAEGEQSKDQL